MITISQLVKILEAKLNNNLTGLQFVLTADTGELETSLRIPNTNNFTEPINGLFSITSNEVSNLPAGELIASVNARLQIIVPIIGEEEDKEFTDGENVQTIEGYGSKITTVRKVLASAFSKTEQIGLVDEEGTAYSVAITYTFADSGTRNQGMEIGDYFTFYATIVYEFVENGVNTYNVIYTLDGKRIPFQSITAYRTPTMDGNVYGNSKNGATKNTASQTVFSVAFELPALKNDITAKIFDFLFDGKMNVAHLLNVKYPSLIGNGEEEKNYLVTFGEIKSMGMLVQNIGQTITLVETDDDYELLSFPESYYIYECKTATDNFSFESFAYFYNADTKEFGNGETGNIEFSAGDYLISTVALSNTTDFEKV